jgi:hypothetical protein
MNANIESLETIYQPIFLKNVIEFGGNLINKKVDLLNNFTLLIFDNKIIAITYIDSTDTKLLTNYNKSKFISFVSDNLRQKIIKKNKSQTTSGVDVDTSGKSFYIINKDSTLNDSCKTGLSANSAFMEVAKDFDNIYYVTRLSFLYTNKELNTKNKLEILTSEEVEKYCNTFLITNPRESFKKIAYDDTFVFRNDVKPNSYIYISGYSNSTSTFSKDIYYVIKK